MNIRPPFKQGSEVFMSLISSGLCSAPVAFSCLKETTLQGTAWEVYLSNIDDVLIVAQTLPQLIQHVEQVFTDIRAARLKLNPKKSANWLAMRSLSWATVSQPKDYNRIQTSCRLMSLPLPTKKSPTAFWD